MLCGSLNWPCPGPGSPHDNNNFPSALNLCTRADRENHRVQIFDSEGKFLDQWTDLIRPTHVYMDKYETVYISELCRRISIFSIDGKLLARWGNESHSMHEPLLVGPHVICVDSRGDLYVGEVAKAFGKVDRGARTIQKFARVA